MGIFGIERVLPYLNSIASAIALVVAAVSLALSRRDTARRRAAESAAELSRSDRADAVEQLRNVCGDLREQLATSRRREDNMGRRIDRLIERESDCHRQLAVGLDWERRASAWMAAAARVIRGEGGPLPAVPAAPSEVRAAEQDHGEGEEWESSSGRG